MQNLCEALLSGYLSAVGPPLATAEQNHLHSAARLISFELGLRFLTGHLQGNNG